MSNDNNKLIYYNSETKTFTDNFGNPINLSDETMALPTLDSGTISIKTVASIITAVVALTVQWNMVETKIEKSNFEIEKIKTESSYKKAETDKNIADLLSKQADMTRQLAAIEDQLSSIQTAAIMSYKNSKK